VLPWQEHVYFLSLYPPTSLHILVMCAHLPTTLATARGYLLNDAENAGGL